MSGLGHGLVYLALGLSLLAWLGFALPGRELQPRLRFSRALFYAQTVLLEVTVALLLNAILTHRFDLDYVFAHSSTDLPTVYLVSTFWSGQEGTFLLWAFYSALLGCGLIARAKDWEPPVMAVFTAVHLLVLMVLVARSPFAPLELTKFSAADQTLFLSHFGGVPPQGQGLNPLLQNPWMAIHPPLLFLGFASMAIPFSFAVAGLLKRDFDGWAVRAQGWVLLGWAILGTAVILGGYWAYETLGWGGYWAWDPVENSSLVPWLFGAALFHGLLFQRVSNGCGQRRSLVLAGATFLSVMYGSYLNRSGVLSDFSVHSFVALSPSFNRVLIAYALVPTVVFAVLLLSHWRSLPARRLEAESWGRVRLLNWVTWLLAGSAAVVLIGNSWPLLSALGGQRSALQPSFYNALHTPWAMLAAGLLSVVMLLDPRESRPGTLLVKLQWPLVAAAAMAVAVTISISVYLRHRAGVPEVMPATAGKLAWAWATLLVLCWLAVVVNARVLWQEARRGERLSVGSHLAHLGFMLLVFGVVVSSVYETKSVIPLPQGEQRQWLGFGLTYRGLAPRAQEALVPIEVRRRGRTVVLNGRLKPGRDGLLRSPAILKHWAWDLYLEPGEIQAGKPAEPMLLKRDEPLRVAGAKVEFGRFDLGAQQQLDPRNFRVGLELRVTKGTETTIVKPWFVVRDGEVRPEPAAWPGGGSVAVVDMPALDGGNDRGMLLEFHSAGLGEVPETAVVQVSLKPGMGVVWLGCWLTILGGLWAAVRRARLAAHRAARDSIGGIG